MDKKPVLHIIYIEEREERQAGEEYIARLLKESLGEKVEIIFDQDFTWWYTERKRKKIPARGICISDVQYSYGMFGDQRQAWDHAASENLPLVILSNASPDLKDLGWHLKQDKHTKNYLKQAGLPDSHDSFWERYSGSFEGFLGRLKKEHPQWKLYSIEKFDEAWADKIVRIIKENYPEYFKDGRADEIKLTREGRRK